MPAPNPDAIKVAKDLSQKAVLLAVARQPGSERLFVGTSDFKVAEIPAQARDARAGGP